MDLKLNFLLKDNVSYDKKILKEVISKITTILIADATGFSYSNDFYARFKRGF